MLSQPASHWQTERSAPSQPGGPRDGPHRPQPEKEGTDTNTEPSPQSRPAKPRKAVDSRAGHAGRTGRGEPGQQRGARSGRVARQAPNPLSGPASQGAQKPHGERSHARGVTLPPTHNHHRGKTWRRRSRRPPKRANSAAHACVTTPEVPARKPEDDQGLPANGNSHVQKGDEENYLRIFFSQFFFFQAI